MFNNYLEIYKKFSDSYFDSIKQQSEYFNNLKINNLNQNISNLNNTNNSNFNIDKLAKENFEHMLKFMVFSLKQAKDANDTNNYFLLNNDAQRKALDTNYQSIYNGMRNFLKDMQNSSHNGFYLKRKHDSFKIGENIAKTPGEVIYRTEVLELIAYNTKSDTAYKIPTLFIPATINKYYVLDLSENNSLINYIVQNDLQAFCISFNNDKNLKYSFEDCVYEIINVINFLLDFCNVKKVNILGYCLGGVLASVTSYLIKDKINSLTFLNTGLDYAEKADFEFFVNKSLLPVLKATGNYNSYMHGMWLQQLFSFLRSKDTIWKYIQNNYLHGNEPFLSDVMYWNDDSTHQSSNMLLYFLEHIYLDSKLTKKQLVIANKTINLEEIDVPIFYVGCLRDHIVTKEAILSSYKSFVSKTSNQNNILCLSGGGHVNGILNPPTINKGHFWLLNKNNCNFDTFCLDKLDNKDNKDIQKFNGSWWNNWLEWLIKYSGNKINVNVNEKQQKTSLCKAPGIYVHKTI
ncbi:MAG: alpha/beta fold hydrolase [Rickettsiales bacterium]